MHTTFNCGVGLVIVIDKQDCQSAIDVLTAQGENVWKLGTISKRDNPEIPVIFS